NAVELAPIMRRERAEIVSERVERMKRVSANRNSVKCRWIDCTTLTRAGAADTPAALCLPKRHSERPGGREINHRRIDARVQQHAQWVTFYSHADRQFMPGEIEGNLQGRRRRRRSGASEQERT